MGGECSNTQILKTRVLPEPPDNFVPIQPRYLDVEQDDMRSTLFNLPERRETVGGFKDFMALRFKDVADQFTRHWAVIDNQHTHGCGGGSRFSAGFRCVPPVAQER
jgi:hypothetical protein